VLTGAKSRVVVIHLNQAVTNLNKAYRESGKDKRVEDIIMDILRLKNAIQKEGEAR